MNHREQILGAVILAQQAGIMFLLGRWGMNARPDASFLIPVTFAAAALLAMAAVWGFIKVIRR